jgi:hypothetical protein
MTLLCSLQADAQIPSDCVGVCMDQYALLNDFDKNTTENYIANHFRRLRKVAKSKSFKSAQYSGVDVDLLTLRDPKKWGNARRCSPVRETSDKAQKQVLSVLECHRKSH